MRSKSVNAVNSVKIRPKQSKWSKSVKICHQSTRCGQHSQIHTVSRLVSLCCPVSLHAAPQQPRSHPVSLQQPPVSSQLSVAKSAAAAAPSAPSHAGSSSDDSGDSSDGSETTSRSGETTNPTTATQPLASSAAPTANDDRPATNPAMAESQQRQRRRLKPSNRGDQPNGDHPTAIASPDCEALPPSAASSTAPQLTAPPSEQSQRR
ncbi:UNVERIFIED_CONTAM: hypothetical protein Sangu_1157500 [Sesamum angustifolium]|uniref:Uncharacterized protein n=1 Tax=Sesamum angustifolium TaxID=2727405 RepID=A0AAW2P0A5_9LAMI